MRAIVITKPGDLDVLQVQERAKPAIGKDEVLIQVKAAGINRPDIFQRKGKYPAPVGVVEDIPGLEVAGIITRVGRAVTERKVGERVCCLVAGGGYAEYVTAHQDMCLSIPEGIGFEEAAILPETVYTVWDNVFRRGALQKGESILIHGGAGGIGSTAIQLAKAFGAKVLTTVSSDEKEAYCRQLGADNTVNYRESDFWEVLGEEKINVVLDSIGGSYFQKNIDLLDTDGRLVYINAVKGHKVELNILKLMQKRILITGSTLRARDLSFKISLTREIHQHVWPLIGKSFRPQLFKTFPLENAAEAHELMENGTFLGKLALVI
ncbi:NAD(P)H-quinone oxidoreductase [Sphingobacterium sp. SGR-19]|uniref:NAD(P)H-quinone oxidoreductase n=1 Tax=Sphingobacterium sp. SGR-19 TaxID=2710886 RepID=UPI0013EA7A2D|nr:NAD(P)H-quinone oxidoreductase [Sphingobacterium sp. SGR-19]NGM63965.1 NAD(P)H-quinone oxidoreductase [Sphingobacterium sp. SGR-19]